MGPDVLQHIIMLVSRRHLESATNYLINQFPARMLSFCSYRMTQHMLHV